jgi:group I intron endonuclease
VYVGQSKIPNNRRSRHWELLRGGKHENPNLQEAYDKYGKDAFVFKILEHCEPDKLLEREEHWINKFLDNCYNVVGVEK